MDPIPLFVIGVHRSGTTWVANTLSNHSRIFAIRSSQYGGIVESWYFSHMYNRFGSLQDPAMRKRFLSTFFQTPFFQSSAVEPEVLHEMRFDSYEDFYYKFMQLASVVKPDARYLLEKTPVHTLYLERLARAYPRARFVSVRRGAQGVVKSALKLSLHTSVKTTPLFVRLLNWCRYEAFIEHFVERFPERFYSLSYEATVADPGTQFAACLAYLGEEWEPQILEEQFSRNTSFRCKQERGELLNPLQEKGILYGGRLLRLLPYSLFRIWEAVRAPRTEEPVPFLLDRPRFQ